VFAFTQIRVLDKKS